MSVIDLSGPEEVLKADAKSSQYVHWEKSLKWARESLICRDIFAQVSSAHLTRFIPMPDPL